MRDKSKKPLKTKEAEPGHKTSGSAKGVSKHSKDISPEPVKDVKGSQAKKQVTNNKNKRFKPLNPKTGQVIHATTLKSSGMVEKTYLRELATKGMAQFLKNEPKKKPFKRSDPKNGTEILPEPKKRLTLKEKATIGLEKALARKTFVYSEAGFSELRGFLVARGDVYHKILSGTTEKIRHDGKTFSIFDKASVGQGFHLSGVVKNDVINWIKENPDSLVKREKDYVEQRFNPNAIEKVVNQLLISVDINDCYWQTVYNQGYITEKTYLSGLRKKKEWKVGRNASVGSLSKSEIEIEMQNGLMVRGLDGKYKKRIIEAPKNFQHVRHNVVGAVCDVLTELADGLQDDFFMYLTDCVFTTVDRKEYVENFFKKYNYTSKIKTFEFTKINKERKLVEWIEMGAPDKPKYYRYSDNQIYIPKQTK